MQVTRQQTVDVGQLLELPDEAISVLHPCTSLFRTDGIVRPSVISDAHGSALVASSVSSAAAPAGCAVLGQSAAPVDV